jgi:hypothetical protein
MSQIIEVPVLKDKKGIFIELPDWLKLDGPSLYLEVDSEREVMKLHLTNPQVRKVDSDPAR